MPVETHQFTVASKGDTHIVDLTPELSRLLSQGRIKNGVVTVFVVGSTAAISTTEFEPGLVNQDLKVAYDRLAPEDGEYLHEQTWHDDNGHAHVRATMTGPSIAVPLVDAQLTLGQWQQVVLMDFDTRRRERKVIVQVVGE